MRRLIATALGLATLGLFGCGGDESTSGRASLKFYVFPEPSGSFAKAAKDCSSQSQGRYEVTINTLPSAADDQRTQLVRRLAAEDSDIDIIGMDVIWTAEFAEAGWLREWTGRVKEEVTRGTLEAP